MTVLVIATVGFRDLENKVGAVGSSFQCAIELEVYGVPVDSPTPLRSSLGVIQKRLRDLRANYCLYTLVTSLDDPNINKHAILP